MPVNAQQDQAHTPASASPAGTGQPGQRTITDPAHMLPEHASPSSGGTRGGKVRTVVILLLIALAIAFVVWRILTNKKTQDQEANRAAAAANRPIPVQVTAVRQETVPVYLTALGTVTAYNTVTLHTRVDGQLLQVNFREGQAVRKGQLLLQIDPRPYQAAVDQAVGTLAKDEANLKNQEAEAQRYTALYQAGVVSKEQQQLQVSNQGQAAGSIKSDEAAIEAARVNLGYTRIVSPIDGVVGLRQVDPGNIVHASDATGLLVITQIHPIALIFTLPEDQLPQVQAAMKTGHPLVVEAYDRSDAHKIASGTLLTIDNQIDTTTGTAKLKAVFDNADNGLFANQFVNVRLILRQRANATVVPTAAIQAGAQGSYVFVVNSGPTPKEKLANQPGASARGSAGAGGSGGHGGHRGAGSNATDASGGTETANAGGEEEESPEAGGGQRKRASCPTGVNHADTVPVHVDLTLGTRSVLADGALHAGQNIVIDGAEKLVDGGNVCMSFGPGAGGASGGTGRRNANGPGASGNAPDSSPANPASGNTGNPNAAPPTGNPQTGAPGSAPASSSPSSSSNTGGGPR